MTPRIRTGQEVHRGEPHQDIGTGRRGVAVDDLRGSAPPVLAELRDAVLRQHGRRLGLPVAVELRDVRDVMGDLAPVVDAIELFGGVVVFDGMEIRQVRSVGRDRYMPVYWCRHCSGDGCARCHGTGEMRGRR